MCLIFKLKRALFLRLYWFTFLIFLLNWYFLSIIRFKMILFFDTFYNKVDTSSSQRGARLTFYYYFSMNTVKSSLAIWPLLLFRGKILYTAQNLKTLRPSSPWPFYSALLQFYAVSRSVFALAINKASTVTRGNQETASLVD